MILFADNRFLTLLAGSVALIVTKRLEKHVYLPKPCESSNHPGDQPKIFSCLKQCVLIRPI